MYFNFRHKDIEFDRKIWINNTSIRPYMVSSIIQNKLIIGLSKEEVVNILGFEFNDKHSDKWTYYVGKKTIFSLKKTIYIYFDGFDKVFKVLFK